MAFTYVQRTGSIYWPDGKKMGIGYSGHGTGLNNPDMQASVGIGPLPIGIYFIAPPHTPVDHLGPVALPLVPDKGNNMHGRSGFLIHGDNWAMNHTASNGCVILSRGFREMISGTNDKVLRVVAEDEDVPK